MNKTKEKILCLWYSSMTNFVENENLVSETVIKAVKIAHGYRSKYQTHVYGNGMIETLPTDIHPFCKWHGKDEQCPECTAIFTIKSWNIIELAYFSEKNDNGENKDNYLWENVMNEWVMKERAIEVMSKLITKNMFENKSQHVAKINSEYTEIIKKYAKEVQEIKRR